MGKNENKAEGASRLEKLREKSVAFMAAAKSATEKYILHGLVMVAAIIVLISGFFVKYEYIPMEQIQTYPAVTSGNVQVDEIISELFSDTKYEQSMFYPFAALAVGDDREENYTQLSNTAEDMLNATNAFVSHKSDLIIKLSLMLSTTEYDADEVMKLINQLNDGASGVYSEVNLMRYEKLEAKEAYMSALDNPSGDAVLLKGRILDDLTVRDAVLSVGSVIYIYLQAVAIVFIVLEALSLIRRRTVSAKFFAFYIPGIFALFAINQLTAVGLNGAAVACCAIAALFGALYALGKVWVAQKGAAARIGLLGLASSLCLLIAACLFASPMYSFGVRANNIGAALGFNCYNNHTFADGELASAIFVNYLPLAAFHAIALALTVVALVKTAINALKGQKSGWILPAVAAGVALAGYIAYKICILCGAVDMIALGGQMLVIVVFNAVAALAAFASARLNEEKSEADTAEDERSEEQSVQQVE